MQKVLFESMTHKEWPLSDFTMYFIAIQYVSSVFSTSVNNDYLLYGLLLLRFTNWSHDIYTRYLKCVCSAHSLIWQRYVCRGRKARSAPACRLDHLNSRRVSTLSRLTLMHVWLDKDDMLSADIPFDVYKVAWTVGWGSPAAALIVFSRHCSLKE